MGPQSPTTERTWMRLGATREQARQLQGIPVIDVTVEQINAALYSHRATNMWTCAIQWLNTGCCVVADENMFYRDIEPSAEDPVSPSPAGGEKT